MIREVVWREEYEQTRQHAFESQDTHMSPQQPTAILLSDEQRRGVQQQSGLAEPVPHPRLRPTCHTRAGKAIAIAKLNVIIGRQRLDWSVAAHCGELLLAGAAASSAPHWSVLFSHSRPFEAANKKCKIRVRVERTDARVSDG